MEQGNVQSVYVAKVVSAFCPAVNPINVIVSFRNSGNTPRLGPDGLGTRYVDVDQCCCLLNPVEVIVVIAPDGGRQDIGNPLIKMEALEDVNVPE